MSGTGPNSISTPTEEPFFMGSGPADCKALYNRDMCYHNCDLEHGFPYNTMPPFMPGSDIGPDFLFGEILHGGVGPDLPGMPGSAHMKCMSNCDMEAAAPECRPCFEKMRKVEDMDMKMYN